jgi:predicted site-specific integrase-resolvase
MDNTDCLISIRAAAKLNNIPHPTIVRWIQKGYIKVYGSGLYGAKLIRSSDIKTLADKYKTNPGQGKSTIKNDT